ncbi:hypothetical protein IV38_GL001775 [Lactobacillus selangorensis]|uniref:LemA family protein n=1 Tax=Lactobacillus selangorensis TaxID=81857 RepID=A0A0R2FH37_9LACO|nr:LemA family protein [Lactobacillus selangorensis]KRN27935.1 hypothetical protein IV38_GL001775 [Lactobacillus selangorensis]KRN30594.1 hypothetical protein IV40_GL001781 [Lactobacillus selangorensis]
MQKRNFHPWLIVLLVILLLGGWGISTYNSLAKESQQVDAAASQVQNVMQRRYDLVPNLVNSVKGSMQQEQKVFGQIADARKSYNTASSGTAKNKANNELDQSVGTLINVINEKYPDLKSNENVQTLMTQLEGSENRISVERKRYNTAVEKYNQSVVTFPKNIFANMMGLGKKPYFKADTKAQEAPQVDLTTDSSSTSGK